VGGFRHTACPYELDGGTYDRTLKIRYSKVVKSNMSLVSKVEIRKSLIEGAGWGAFITEDVMKGALIEECVVFPLSNELDGLDDYRLKWTEKDDAMGSGCANIYNHSEDPNVEFSYIFDLNIIRIHALKNLTRGQELYKKYSCQLWFTAQNPG